MDPADTPPGTQGHIDTPLGPLTRQGEWWHGLLPNGGRTLHLRFRTEASAPLDTLVGFVQQSLKRLDQLVHQAQTFALRGARATPSTLELVGLEMSVPGPEWLRRHHLPVEPMLTLTFAIADDRNVLDVVFHDAEPIAFEYH
jgi:hypothetical protein